MTISGRNSFIRNLVFGRLKGHSAYTLGTRFITPHILPAHAKGSVGELMRKAARIILFGSLALSIGLVIVWMLGYFFAVPAIVDQFSFWIGVSMVACFGIFLGIVLLMFSSVKK